MTDRHEDTAGRGEFPHVTDPRVIRVLLRYREAVAQATEQAYRDLADLGLARPEEAAVADPDGTWADCPRPSALTDAERRALAALRFRVRRGLLAGGEA